MAAPAPGLHLVHKERGAKSFSLVRALQEAAAAAGEERPAVCHGGALDPFAEGLMLLLVGPATRLMEQFHPVPKVYEAEVVFGAETDSGDLHGAVVSRADGPPRLDARQLEEALQSFLGWHDQVPPATSNKRVGGERAWARAHRGEAVELPASPVYLHEARWLELALPLRGRLWLSCRGGFYVRSLVRDLGRLVGCGAHLTGLWRRSIGPHLDPGPGKGQLVQGAALLPWLQSRELSEEEAARAELRRPLPLGALQPGDGSLPPGFAGPGARPGEVEPIRGLQGGRLRLLLRRRGQELVLHTDLLGGT